MLRAVRGSFTNENSKMRDKFKLPPFFFLPFFVLMFYLSYSFRFLKGTRRAQVDRPQTVLRYWFAINEMNQRKTLREKSRASILRRRRDDNNNKAIAFSTTYTHSAGLRLRRSYLLPDEILSAPVLGIFFPLFLLRRE